MEGERLCHGLLKLYLIGALKAKLPGSGQGFASPSPSSLAVFARSAVMPFVRVILSIDLSFLLSVRAVVPGNQADERAQCRFSQ